VRPLARRARTLRAADQIRFVAVSPSTAWRTVEAEPPSTSVSRAWARASSSEVQRRDRVSLGRRLRVSAFCSWRGGNSRLPEANVLRLSGGIRAGALLE